MILIPQKPVFNEKRIIGCFEHLSLRQSIRLCPIKSTESGPDSLEKNRVRFRARETIYKEIDYELNPEYKFVESRSKN